MNEYLTIFAIIPSEIYKTKKLTSTEKLIAERLTALCANKGYVWITNKALANMYGVREDTVSKYIKRLESFGFINCKYDYKEQNKIKRTIYLTDDTWGKQTNTNSLNERSYTGCKPQYNINSNIKKNNKDNIYNKIIDYDTDGVMLWHGKRCEAFPMSDEETNEMEDLLAPFIDNDE